MIEGGKLKSGKPKLRKSNSRKSNSEITKKCDSKPNDENSLQTIINDILTNDKIYLYKDVCKEEGKVIHNYYVFNQLPPDSLNTRNYDSIDNFNSIEHSNAPKFYKYLPKQDEVNPFKGYKITNNEAITNFIKANNVYLIYKKEIINDTPLLGSTKASKPPINDTVIDHPLTIVTNIRTLYKKYIKAVRDDKPDKPDTLKEINNLRESLISKLRQKDEEGKYTYLYPNHNIAANHTNLNDKYTKITTSNYRNPSHLDDIFKKLDSVQNENTIHQFIINLHIYFDTKKDFENFLKRYKNPKLIQDKQENFKTFNLRELLEHNNYYEKYNVPQRRDAIQGPNLQKNTTYDNFDETAKEIPTVEQEQTGNIYDDQNKRTIYSYLRNRLLLYKDIKKRSDITLDIIIELKSTYKEIVKYLKKPSEDITQSVMILKHAICRLLKPVKNEYNFPTKINDLKRIINNLKNATDESEEYHHYTITKFLKNNSVIDKFNYHIGCRVDEQGVCKTDGKLGRCAGLNKDITDIKDIDDLNGGKKKTQKRRKLRKKSKSTTKKGNKL